MTGRPEGGFQIRAVPPLNRQMRTWQETCPLCIVGITRIKSIRLLEENNAN